MDGAGEWRTFFQMMLPMAAPGMASVAIFNFLGLWNQFLLPVALNTDRENYVLSQGMASFASQAGYNVDFGAVRRGGHHRAPGAGRLHDLPAPAAGLGHAKEHRGSHDADRRRDDEGHRPTDPTDLTDLIRTVAPRLTGALREVADTVLADPAEAARLSAVALAARAGVSQASVTRFAQSIGLASHAELRLALAEQKGRSTAPGVAMDVGVQIHPDDSVRQVIKVVANADIRAITQTVNQLDHHALDLASRAIAAARRVDVYGIGSSASVAYELETRLFRVGVRVRAWTEVHEALTSAALLTADDVAIAISHSGATSEVVEPLRLAADRGAVTVGLTGDPRSAVAAASRHMLTTAALETSYRNGSLAARHSQMMIADCLYIRVVQLTPERAAESMALTEHIAPSHAVAARRSRVRQDTP